jgi:WD40 repeat protein
MSGTALKPAWQAHTGDYPRAAAWHADGSALFVGDAAGRLYAYRASDGGLLWSTQAQEGGITALAAHPQEPLVASGGEDGRLRLLHADGSTIETVNCGRDWVLHLAWSPDGQRLAAATGRTLQLRDLQGTLVAEAGDHASTVAGLVWGLDEVVTACYGRIAIRDPRDATPRQAFEWKGSPISLALSPDGAVVACGSQDKTVRFWRRASGEDAEMAGYPGKPAALVFSHDSALLATAGAEYVAVWSFLHGGPEGTTPRILEAHLGMVTTLAFARGRHLLASGSKDGRVVVWDVESGDVESGDVESGNDGPTGIGVTGGGVESVLWSPGDDAVASIDAACGVCVWPTPGHGPEKPRTAG